ncbi:MAG: beta-ketoacyl-ACP synthase II [Burkholderiales bacterium]|nr:MAG: beta-ketoacyl-ACP synthase II [Burkholderiales bacterium]
MSRRRAVVTGLGIVSPVGNTVEAAWDNVVAGRSGIGRITRFDPSPYSSQIAGEVRDFDLESYIPAKEARHMDAFIHFGIAAGMQAIRDSGIDFEREDLERVGVVVSSGIGGLPMIEQNHTELLNRGPRRISPFFVPGSIINMISGHLSIMFGLKGPNLSIVTACTTGTHSVGEAARLIEYGDADVMLAGGSEATVSPLGVGGFAAMRALSTRNDDPQAASRPWDRNRDGFVLGEGAGVLLVEEFEHARKRGARIYAEVAGYGMSADANHMTAPCADGDGAGRCMLAALRNASIDPGRVDYINAHGTSTPLGDIAESIAVRRALGDRAGEVVVSSTKSMTGHLLGAAGGIEAVFTALSVHRQVAPPTINLDDPDPDSGLDHCANEARQMRIEVALSNSFGFGGTNGTLVLTRV